MIDSGGTDVQSSSTTKELYGVPITHNVPDLRRYPRAFCKFQVGENGVNFVTVRWSGEGLKTHRNMFDITTTQDTKTGVIYTNLTMRVTRKLLREKNYTKLYLF